MQEPRRQEAKEKARFKSQRSTKEKHQSSCESTQEAWCFFDHFLLVLLWSLLFGASLASWLSWHLGSFPRTIVFSN
jgi:hypothetical protein